MWGQIHQISCDWCGTEATTLLLFTEELNRVRKINFYNVLSMEQKPLTTPQKHRRVDHIEYKLFVMMINVSSDVEQ